MDQLLTFEGNIMTKKLRVQISVQSIYRFEMPVPDDYDKEEAGMLASTYFDEYDNVDEWLVDRDFQIDDVEEVEEIS